MLWGHENTFDTIRVAAGGGVSADSDCGDGALFLAGAAVSAAGVCLSSRCTDGLAAGSGSFCGADLGGFVLSRPGQSVPAGGESAAVAGGWDDCGD